MGSNEDEETKGKKKITDAFAIWTMGTIFTVVVGIDAVFAHAIAPVDLSCLDK